MGKGKRYELDLKNSIIEATNEHVTAMRPDYSGNSKHSVADIRVTVDKGARFGDGSVEDYYIEAKKRSGPQGQRQRVLSGSSKGQSGKEELNDLIMGTPSWAEPRVAVKFDHRELIVLDAKELLFDIEDPEYMSDQFNHGARLTPANSVSMVKPTLGEWNSTSAGEPDHIRLLHDLGIGDYFITEDY